MWHNGTEFTWVNGRQLQSAVNGGNTVSYTYNTAGLRMTKTVNDLEYKYIWQGDKLISEYYDGKALEFFYDESGKPYAMSYKENATAEPRMYYYVTNLQGDILSMVDADGFSVAEYYYNAYGLPMGSSGEMADINPLRYRSYYFDNETGLYYLKSRYYDPAICRWINADTAETLIVDLENIVQYNVFAYCFNNPVNMSDKTGTWPDWATKLAIGVGAIVVGAAVVAATAATGGAAAAFVGAAVTGLKAAAVSGAIGAVVGAGTNAVSHRVSTGSWSGAGKAAVDGAVDGFSDGVMYGGITAGAGMAIGGLAKTSAGIQIGTTAKPQYGIINAFYGTPKVNGSTIVSIQNNLGKRLFSLDLDIVHGVHMHLPTIIPKKHIPIGSIISGFISGIK